MTWRRICELFKLDSIVKKSILDNVTCRLYYYNRIQRALTCFHIIFDSGVRIPAMKRINIIIISMLLVVKLFVYFIIIYYLIYSFIIN